MPNNNEPIFVPRPSKSNKGMVLRRRDIPVSAPVRYKGLDDGDLDDPIDFRESELFVQFERILMAFLRSQWAMGDEPTVGTIGRSFKFHPYLNDALESLAAGRSIEYAYRGSRCHVTVGAGFKKQQAQPYSSTLKFGGKKEPHFWYNDGTTYGRHDNSGKRHRTATA